MNRRLQIKLALALATFGLLMAALPPAAAEDSSDIESKSGFVIVEQNESAFTVFTGIPEDTGEEVLEDLRTRAAEHEKASLLGWEVFMSSIDELARSTMLRDDYPDTDSVAGLVCLLATQPGAPWGLTWNGGIALTYNDYQHARKTYETYTNDPEAYESIRRINALFCQVQR
jgi:hypothetical protein